MNGACDVRGRQKLHPATKTCLALRIAVNRELEELGRLRAPFIAVVLLLCVALAGCGAKQVDAERGAWVTIRDADAALDGMTDAYEHWKEAGKPFTAAELETLRGKLFAGNEALAASEASFAIYRAIKHGSQSGDPATQLAALQRALDDLKRAVAAAREVFNLFSKRAASLHLVGVYVAAVDGAALFLILQVLLGDLITAFMGGKKGAITQAAIAVVAQVLRAHKEATGEDIDLESPALRARIADRRNRLAKLA